MSLYNKNGITITVSPDGRNYMVEGKFPISYHATLDKAVLKVAKHEADKAGPLWDWLQVYCAVAEDVSRWLTTHLSRLEGEVTHSTSEGEKVAQTAHTGLYEPPVIEWHETREDFKQNFPTSDKDWHIVTRTGECIMIDGGLWVGSSELASLLPEGSYKGAKV